MWYGKKIFLHPNYYIPLCTCPLLPEPIHSIKKEKKKGWHGCFEQIFRKTTWDEKGNYYTLVVLRQCLWKNSHWLWGKKMTLWRIHNHVPDITCKFTLPAWGGPRSEIASGESASSSLLPCIPNLSLVCFMVLLKQAQSYYSFDVEIIPLQPHVNNWSDHSRQVDP